MIPDFGNLTSKHALILFQWFRIHGSVVKQCRSNHSRSRGRETFRRRRRSPWWRSPQSSVRLKEKRRNSNRGPKISKIATELFFRDGFLLSKLKTFVHYVERFVLHMLLICFRSFFILLFFQYIFCLASARLQCMLLM